MAPNSASRINKYERGAHSPDFSTAARLAKTLKVPVAYFYAPEDVLASLVLHLGQMDGKSLKALLSELTKHPR